MTSARVVDEEAQLRSRRAAVVTDEVRGPIKRGLGRLLAAAGIKRRSVLVNAGLPEPEG